MARNKAPRRDAYFLSLSQRGKKDAVALSPPDAAICTVSGVAIYRG